MPLHTVECSQTFHFRLVVRNGTGRWQLSVMELLKREACTVMQVYYECMCIVYACVRVCGTSVVDDDVMMMMMQVMLLTTSSLDDIYHKACALADDPDDVREPFQHPTRLIQFLVGLRGKNEPMAIGGPWSPSLDGPDPAVDQKVLVKTAIRTTTALTGIDLSNCTQWYVNT